MTDKNFSDWIKETPKSELHIHLLGAMPKELCLSIVKGRPLKKILRNSLSKYFFVFKVLEKHFSLFGGIREFLVRKDIKPLLNFKTFDQFLIAYLFLGYLIKNRQDLNRLIEGVIKNLEDQGITYAEITVSPIHYINQGISLKKLIKCMDRASNNSKIKIRWIIDLVRDLGPRATFKQLKKVTRLKSKSIIGITIGGSEHIYPAEKFSKTFQLAREKGLRLTIHAGEASGPESIWNALKIGAERIGHGVRAIEDPKLVKHLAKNKIPLEICLTSNIKTKVYKSYKEHPVKQLYKAGVPITINTDDPLLFQTNLNKEYSHLKDLGFTKKEIQQIIQNGFKYAFSK